MHIKLSLAFLAILTNQVVSQALLDALAENGYTSFADAISSLSTPSDSGQGSIVIFAPPNAAFNSMDKKGDSSASSTEDSPETAAYGNGPPQIKSSVSMEDQIRYQQCKDTAVDLRRQEGGNLNRGFETFLINPELVNLGGTTGQGIVQTGASIRSGGGNDVGIAGADIYFDGGVIRPVTGYVQFFITNLWFLKSFL